MTKAISQRLSLPRPECYPWVASRYYQTAFAQGNTVCTSSYYRQLFGEPFYVPNSGGMKLSEIGLDIPTTADAAGSMRLGIYRDENGLPAELLLDTGIVSLNVTPRVFCHADINFFVPQGWFWAALIHTSSAVRFQGLTTKYLKWGGHGDLYNTEIGVLLATYSDAGSATPWLDTGLPFRFPLLYSTSYGAIWTNGVYPRIMVQAQLPTWSP